MKIGFIGTGVMGASIVKHLLKAGYEVDVYSRTKEKAQQLLNLGANWADTPAKASLNKDIVFTMVGYPTDVEQVYFDEEGIFTTVKQGAILVDMTTSEPSLAQKIYEYAKNRSVYALDAPVSGGDLGAKNGTLSIMIGGDLEIFKKVSPVLSTFGANIVFQGTAGAGQHTKMCNQIAATGVMIGVCECIAYGLRAGLNIETVLQSVTPGAAGSWTLSNLAPRMIKGDFSPGFYVKHFVKDMNIALQEAQNMNLQLPGLQLVKDLYEQLIKQGYGEDGTQALLKYYQ